MAEAERKPVDRRRASSPGVLGDFTQEIINVTVEIEFKRRPYAGKQSTDTMEFRVGGVLVVDTDDYHLYVTNLPDEFTPRQIAAFYGLRWEVELLFRELKSLYGLEDFETSDPANYWPEK